MIKRTKENVDLVSLDSLMCSLLPKNPSFQLSFLRLSSETKPGPEIIKLFSCSTQLRRKFVLLINFKLLTIANSFLLNIAEDEIFSVNRYENANYCWHFHTY